MTRIVFGEFGLFGHSQCHRPARAHDGSSTISTNPLEKKNRRLYVSPEELCQDSSPMLNTPVGAQDSSKSDSHLFSHILLLCGPVRVDVIL
jgi:hypothetical protein